MRRKQYREWRSLPHDQRKALLIRTGMDPDMAEEYLDDPNAVPHHIQKQMVELMKADTPET